MRYCNTHKIFDENDFPRKCNKCNEEQCKKLEAQYFQSCGSDAPFVCLNGSAQWGCSSNEYVWAAAVETTCSECCDVKGC